MKRLSVLLVLLLGGGCIFVLGWYVREFVGFAANARPRKGAETPAVAIGEVTAEKFNPPEEFVGHVEPVQEVDILPQIEGYVKEVKFTEGDEVKAGDLLFVIDDERYAAEEGVAKAEVDSAKSKVVQAEAAVDRAERLLRRLQAADARGITQTELDAAETGLASDRAALGSAKSAVSQAKAKLASTAFNMKHTRIFAPIGGRIGKSLMHAGDFVSPSKGALARIVQMDPVRVTFPITDRAYLAWGGARVGDTRRLRLRLADGTIYPSNGKWAFSDNEMSTETATLLVRAHFPNKNRLLVPNAYVTVLADEADPAPVPVIPVSALMQTAQATGVWVMEGEDTVRFRAAEPGARANGKIRLLTGVKPGEKIVVQGIHKLGDGMRVRVVPASEFN